MQLPQYSPYASYKATGIEWISEAPEHWEIKPIAAAAQVVSEAGQPNLELLSVYLGRGVIRFSDVDAKRTNATSTDLSKYQVVRPGNLVLNNQQAWRGSVGVSEYEGIVSPAYIVLKLSGDFDARFADYYFQTSTTVAHFLVSSKGVGTIQRNLYWPSLKRCPVTIPPITEQVAIARFLDSKTIKLDQAIKIKEDQISLLKERKQIIIREAVIKGLNPSALMKDSGIDWMDEIPAHWQVKPLRYLSKTHSGYGFPVELQGDETGNVPFMKVSDFSSSQRFIQSANNYVSERTIAKKGWKKVPAGCLVTAKIGEALRKNHRNLLGRDAVIDNNCIGFEPTGVDVDFFYYLHRVIDFDWFVNPGAVPSISVQKYRSLPVALPPHKEQLKISEYIDAETNKVDEGVRLKELQIEALKEYKASLINSAVTGKIKVI